MAFEFDMSDGLKGKLRKLAKREKRIVGIINKKVKEIIANDEKTIERYKNLRHDMKTHKRVHIGKYFVLVFRVFKKENFILFEDFSHHDNIYGR